MMNPTDETTPTPEATAAEGMRKLDVAAGGDEVPIGPLGGPTPKTRERLLAEQEVASSDAADRENIDAEKEKVLAEAEAEASKQPAPDGPLS